MPIVLFGQSDLLEMPIHIAIDVRALIWLLGRDAAEGIFGIFLQGAVLSALYESDSYKLRSVCMSTLIERERSRTHCVIVGETEGLW